jgi:hypothetical protein
MSTTPDRNPGGLIIGLVVVAFCILVVVMTGWDQLNAFIPHNQNPGTFLLIFATAAIFPISALAYQIFPRESQLQELQRVFKLCGIIKPDPQNPQKDSGEVDKDILKRYNSIYNPWNFAIHSTLVVLLTVLGLSLICWPPSTGKTDLLDVNTSRAMSYGFVGA